jgi:hypothetical protein
MKPQPPKVLATFERAFRPSNIAMHSVALQVRRLRSAEPEDVAFIFRKWSDFDFLVVALTRMRRSVQLACELPQVKPALESALHDFDERLPGLKRTRDVAEHVGDYALERGHLRSVSRFVLETYSLSARGPSLNWLGARVNASSPLRAAERLFLAMQTAKTVLRRSDA